MRLTILLLICLAAVALIEAGHHHNDRHDRRQEGRDDRRTDKRRDSREDRREDRRENSREHSRENSRENSREDRRENSREDRRENSREDSREDKRQDSSENNNKRDNRDDNSENRRKDRREEKHRDNKREKKQDNRERHENNSRERDIKEQQKEDSREDKRQDSSENNNKRDNRDDNSENRRKDRREEKHRDNKKERKQDNRERNENNSRERDIEEQQKEDSREDKRQKSSENNNKRDNRNDSSENRRKDRREEKNRDNKKERKQDNREINENNSRERDIKDQDNDRNTWQQNRQPWRDIVIQNRGKIGEFTHPLNTRSSSRIFSTKEVIIVNNGEMRDSEQGVSQKQALLDRLGYTQNLDERSTTDMKTLLKQKFLLSLLLQVNDKKTEDELEELGQTLILDEQKYDGGFDEDMHYLVQLCVDGQMLRESDNFNGMNSAHLRQLQGLFKLLVRARDWETFQSNACFARLHLNRVLVVNALMLAVKERQDTQELIMPAINEVLPELFYDEQLLQKSRDINLNDLVGDSVTRKPNIMDLIRGGWSRPFLNENRAAGTRRGGWGGGFGGMQPKKTWQEWRQEKLYRQAGRGGEQRQFEQNELQKIVLTEEKMANTKTENLDQRISYLTRDSGLSNFWYSLGIDCLRQMKLPTTERKETDERSRQQLLNSNEIERERVSKSPKTSSKLDRNEMKIRSLTPEQQKRMIEAMTSFLRGQKNKSIKNPEETKRQYSREGLPTSNINNERLLRVNRRRLNQNLESEERSQVPTMNSEEDDASQSESDEMQEENMERTPRNNRIDNKRLLTTNRRRANQQNWDDDSVEINILNEDQSNKERNWRRDNKQSSEEDEEQLIANNRRPNLFKLFGRIGKETSNIMKKLQVSNEKRDRDSIRQDSNENIGLNSIEKTRQLSKEERMHGSSEERVEQLRNLVDENRLLGSNRRWRMRQNMLQGRLDDVNTDQSQDNKRDSSEESHPDSSEEESVEQRRQNSKENRGVLGKKSFENQRWLRANQRLLNNKNMIGGSPIKQRSSQRIRKLLDSSKERRQSSEELSKEDSDEEIERLNRDSNEVERLLAANRRRWSQNSEELSREHSGEQIEGLNRDSNEDVRLLAANRRGWSQISKELSREYSDEENERLNRNTNENERLLAANRRGWSQISKELSKEHSDEQIERLNRYSNDNERLLNVNRQRWSQNSEELSQKHSGKQIERRNRNSIEDERLRDANRRRWNQNSEELSKEHSGDQIERLNRNSNEDERLLGVNRRRWSQSSPRTMNRQEMHQSWRNEINSDEIRRPESNEDIWMMRKNNERLRNTDSSVDSNSDENSNERYGSKVQEVSSEDLREELNRRTTNERLLAIGRRRLPRSIDSQLDKQVNVADLRVGEMMLTNMQQMLARLRMERLSHQLEQILEDKQKLNGDSKQRKNDLKRQRLETRNNKELELQLQNVENVLRSIINEELQLLSTKKDMMWNQSNVLEIIGRIFLNRLSNEDTNVYQVWSHLMQVLSEDSNSLLTNMAQQLQDPGMNDLMQHVLNAANEIIDNLPRYDTELLKVNDIQLNDVKVDKLQTYFDTTDVDLLNAIDQRALHKQQIDLKDIRSTPVVRQQRLNHKSFSIKLDVNSKRERRVVIRMFLGPKLDMNGNEVTLQENRRNFMLLDAFTTNLIAGQNTIKRKSSDINWTSRDSTPLSQIYREVMLAIDGTNDLQLDRLTGNNQRFPHRLLLPRGLQQGLPMQLFIIVTPQGESDRVMEQRVQLDSTVLGMGTAAIGLDTLPVGFPLDRRIDNEQDILGSNAVLKDVLIYHDGAGDK